MKYIEDYQDKHKGKEIWIVGCGPSLDDFPDDFFKGKISIGLNASFVAFPDLTYFCAGDSIVLPFMIQINPKLMKRLIWILWEKGRYSNHPRTLAPKSNFFGKYKEDPIYATRRLEVHHNIEVFKRALKPTIEDIMEKKKICHVISLKSISHSAIQCAVILGTKKITLVGCEGKTTKHRYHAQKRGMHDAYAQLNPRRRVNGISRIAYSRKEQRGDFFYLYRLGIKLLAKELKPHGIMVRRYYYKSGYEPVA